MSIKLDPKSKTYYVEYRKVDALTGKKAKSPTKKRGFLTKKDARIFEASLLKNLSSSYNPVFSFVGDEYINSLDSNESSKALFRGYLRRHFDFYDYSFKSINKPSLVAWNGRLGGVMAPRTSNVIISLVKSVYKYANNVYDVEDISFVLHRFKITRTPNDMQVWCIDEFNQFISFENNPIYHAFFSCLFWTGCRRGEAIALQKSDFSLNDKTIDINKSMKHYCDGFQKTKTPQSVRVVALDDSLAAELADLSKLDGDYLFGYDTPLSITSIQREFTRVITLSGVKPIRLHDLRHSHATILINAGVNIVAVSRRLGHSSVNVTLETYTHLLQDTSKDLINKLNSLR